MRIALFVVLLVGCNAEHKEATSKAPAVAPNLPTAAAADAALALPKPVGWWRSDTLCLELFENGDFELAVMASGPKVMIIGTAKATAERDAWKLELTPSKIWQARFIGNCRKTVINAKMIEEQYVLGAKLVPNQTASFTLRIGPDAASLCFEGPCQSLPRETPTLRGRWQVPGTDEYGAAPKVPKGQIVRLDLAGPSYTWALNVEAKDGYDSTYGTENDKVTFVGLDHYKIDLGPKHFTATRLAGHRLELCEGTKCTMLERGFDQDRTDVPCRE